MQTCSPHEPSDDPATSPKWGRDRVDSMPLFRRKREDEDEPVHPPQRGYDWYKDRKPIPNG